MQNSFFVFAYADKGRRDFMNESHCNIKPMPAVINIDRQTKTNTNYRKVLWTGEYLQVTVMCIPPGGDIGLECHPDTDQFIRIEQGCALVEMGCQKHCLNQRQTANPDYAVLVPAGTWHNVTNIGRCPLRVYSIYAPPHHPVGLVEPRKPE